MVEQEVKSEPTFIENAAGTLFWVSAGVFAVSFLAGGEVDVIQDIPGAAGMLFFGEMWLNHHSARKAYDKTTHPVHHALNMGRELGKTKIRRAAVA